MGTIRKCVVLCWLGTILFTAQGAPITDLTDGLRVQDDDIKTSYKMSSGSKQTGVVPCFSTLKGYGLCDGYLFSVTPTYNFDRGLAYSSPDFTRNNNIQYQQQVSSVHGKILQNPSYKFSYPNTYTTPYEVFAHPNIIPQSIVADQFVVVITPSTKDPKEASNEQQSAIPSSETTASLSTEVTPSNVEQAYSALKAVFQMMNDISRNVTKELMEGEVLQRKINSTEALLSHESNETFSYLANLKSVFQSIEKIAKNITDVTSALINFRRKGNSVVLSSHEKAQETGEDKDKTNSLVITDSKSHDESERKARASVQGGSYLPNGDYFDRISSKIDNLDNHVKNLAIVVHNLENNISKGTKYTQISSNGSSKTSFEVVMKKMAEIAEELKSAVQFMSKVTTDIENGFIKLLQEKVKTSSTVSDKTDDMIKDQTEQTRGNTSLQGIPENINRKKREVDHPKDEQPTEASDKLNILLDDKIDINSVLAIFKSIEKLFAGVYRLEDFNKAMSEIVFTNNSFKEGIQKREATDDAIKLRKNDLYDIMERAFKSHNFDNSIIDTYLDKASKLAKSGVEPFDILVDTLSNLLLLTIESIQDRRMKGLDKEVHNKELYQLIQDALEQNRMEWEGVYRNKFDDIQSRGMGPFRLMIDFLGDLYFVMYEKTQGKNNDETEKDALISKAFDLYLFTISKIKF